MYVCTYVCREEKKELQHTEKGRKGRRREGHTWQRRNVERERGNEKEN